jgi:histidinol-phosphatase (PHP family)
MEEYVLSALSNGFSALGFSCHAPGTLEDDWHMKRDDFLYYVDEMYRLKQIYSDRIELYTGLELDYLEDTRELVGQQYVDQLDYTIASVHMMKHKKSGAYLSVDGPIEEFTTLLADNFNNDIEAFVNYYFTLEEKMIAEHSFDILGHCDLIKKHNKDNRFFDPTSPWYTKITNRFLKVVAKHHTRIEINTGGIARGATKEVYPSPSMLLVCNSLGIPITLNSDAHESSKLDFFFSSADDLLVQQGYRSIEMLLHGMWQEVTIV